MKKLFLLFCCLCSAAVVHAVSVTIIKVMDAPCGNPIGILTAQASGGVGPYTFQWSNGATTPNVENLPPGSYTVTVTDANNDQASTSMNVDMLPGYPYSGGSLTGLRNCPGSERIAALDFDPSGVFTGPAPHSITNFPSAVFTGGTALGEGWFVVDLGNGAAGEQFTVQWTDGTGCPGFTDVTASQDWVDPQLISLSSTAACNGNNGSIHGTFTHVPQQYTGYTVVASGGALVTSGASNADFGSMDINVYGLAPGGYWIILDPDAENLGMPVAISEEQVCSDSIYIEVEDHSGSCGQLSGKAYFDHDQDCVPDASEPGIPDHMITIEPGGYVAYTSPSGYYAVNLPNGSYTVSLAGTGTDLHPICPPTPDVAIAVAGVNLTQSFADSSLVPLDVTAVISGGTARPGFHQNLWLAVQNASGQLSGPLEITLTVDPMMSFLSADVPPTTVAGNTASWTGQNALAAYQHQWIHVQLLVPADIGLLDQPFTHTVVVSQPETESSLANNTAAFGGVVVGSVDPNEKVARTSTATSPDTYFIGQDEWIDYTIRFQNTGTDTAFTVVVKDSISPLLDMATLEMRSTSHPYEVSFRPGRTVEWRFDNILLPDSNTNEPLSHGQIDLRIKPVGSVPVGSVLANMANIYFDFNPPVRTNVSALVVENSTAVPLMHASAFGLSPNPMTDRFWIRGTDGQLVNAAQVQVFNAQGRLVLNAAVRNGVLEVERLPAGPYMVVVRGEGKPVSLPFVKF